MLDETSLAERLKFMSITRERTNMTKKHLPEFRKAIGSALEVFYKRMAETPATARMVPSGTDLHRTRSAQAAHWERLLGGELDQDYIRTSRHIGETHARIGIEPQWYMGGYGLVLSAMIQELVPAMLDGRLWGRKVREAELTEALSGLVSLAVLDMELGVSTYIEALERQRDASKAERDRLASAIDRLSSAMEEMTSNIGQTAQSSAQTESLALQVAQGPTRMVVPSRKPWLRFAASPIGSVPCRRSPARPTSLLSTQPWKLPA
jgi:truncated hemoglobin YjbI